MKIQSLTVSRFGIHEDLTLTFSSGVSAACHPNGWGKTTLFAFIKAMFYGLAKTKSTDLEENDRKHYLPWSGECGGGSLTYETAAGVFRIERVFGKKAADDTAKLFDCKTERECRLPECLGEELFGLDADGFERTVFLSERHLRGKNENKTVAARISSLSGIDGDIGDLDGAIENLEDARKQLHKKGGGGDIGELSTKIAEGKLRLSQLKREAAVLEEKTRDLEETNVALDAARADAEKLQKEVSETSDADDAKHLEAAIKREQERSAEDREKFESARVFFGEHVPTLEMIRQAESAYQATKNSSGETFEKTPEFTQTEAFFRRPTDEEELKNMDEKLQKAAQTGGICRFSAVLALIPAVLIAVILHSPLGYGIAAGLACVCPLLTVYFVGKKGREAKAEVLRFIAEYPVSQVEPRAAIGEIKKRFFDLSFQNASAADARKRQADRAQEIDRQRAISDAFLSAYPLAPDDPFPYETVRKHYDNYTEKAKAVAESDERLAELRALHVQKTNPEVLQKRAELHDALTAKNEQIAALTNKVATLTASVGGAESIYIELEELTLALPMLEGEKAKKEKKLEVNSKTQEFLRGAYEALTAKYLGKTKEAFFANMRAIDGADASYSLSTSLVVSKKTNGLSHGAECHSGGTQDLLDFVLRVSLDEALFSDERPPLLFDDPFSKLDDGHQGQAQKLLAALGKKYQILYFTCTADRMPK